MDEESEEEEERTLGGLTGIENQESKIWVDHRFIYISFMPKEKAMFQLLLGFHGFQIGGSPFLYQCKVEFDIKIIYNASLLHANGYLRLY